MKTTQQKTRFSQSFGFFTVIICLIIASSLLSACGPKTQQNSELEKSSSSEEQTELASDKTAQQNTEVKQSASGQQTTTAQQTIEKQQKASDKAKQKLRIGASPKPHAEVLEAAKTLLAEEGIDLEIVEFTDYVLPNRAVQDGDIDGNYFQHKPYLDQYNAENNSDLISLGPVHYEPFGLYAGKLKSLDDLKDGASVGLPNDVSNQARALLLLEDAGWITLKAGIDSFAASILDIAENPHKLEFVELAAAQLPRSLSDLDYAIINGNYALEAGLSVADDALLTEKASSAAASIYANILCTSKDKQDDPRLQALYRVLQSQEIKDFLLQSYKGAVVASDVEGN